MNPYDGYVPVPPPSLNGGLFTGPPPPEGAPWAAIPVVPDVDYMINKNLRTANPPPGAIYQYPGNIRPGNNFQAFSGLTPYTGKPNFGPFDFMCAPCTDKPKPITKNMWCIGENTIDHCDQVKIIPID